MIDLRFTKGTVMRIMANPGRMGFVHDFLQRGMDSRLLSCAHGNVSLLQAHCTIECWNPQPADPGSNPLAGLTRVRFSKGVFVRSLCSSVHARACVERRMHQTCGEKLAKFWFCACCLLECASRVHLASISNSTATPSHKKQCLRGALGPHLGPRAAGPSRCQI